MAKIINYSELIHLLSIDVVCGAIISNLFIARVLDVDLPWVCVLVLGCAVWLIYTVDHLMDAKKLQKSALSPRHFFHQKHFKTLTFVAGIVFLIGLSLLFFLPEKVLMWGSMLLLLVGAYFWILHVVKPKWFPKEIIISIIYVAAIFLAPVSLSRGGISWEVPVLFLEYIILALSNLLLIAWYEKERDRKENQISSLQFFSEKWVRAVIFGSLAVNFILNIYYFIVIINQGNFTGIPIVFILMTLTLLVVLLRPGIFGLNERYRKWGDAVFLYPLIWLVW